MYNIDILLPTYNGSLYLEELINSILKQSVENWRILIHDDVSSDNTIEICQKFLIEYPDKIQIIENQGQHLGIIGSYAKLLESSDADYIMLCDHDDIWLQHKIKKSIEKIQELEGKYGKDIPLMVHTDLIVVDQKLNVLEKSFWKYRNLNPNIGNSINRLLLQNIVTGCTILINKKLKELSIPIPAGALIHDWWIALIAVVFGKIGYITEPLILYRQHTSNAMGAKRFNIKYILNLILKNRDKIKGSILESQIQAEVFLNKFSGFINNKDLKIITEFVNISKKDFIVKRLILIRYGFSKSGITRNIGLFLFI